MSRLASRQEMITSRGNSTIVCDDLLSVTSKDIYCIFLLFFYNVLYNTGIESI